MGVGDKLSQLGDLFFGSVDEEQGNVPERLCGAQPVGDSSAVAGEPGEVDHDDVGRVGADGAAKFRNAAAAVVFGLGSGVAKGFEQGSGFGWFPVDYAHAHTFRE